MSSAPMQRKVNREQLFEEIKKIIIESPDHSAALSTSSLADLFGVQAPTIDYHLKKLVEEGKLEITPKKGKYNRKIYTLKEDNSTNPDVDIHIPSKDIESAKKYKRFLQQFIKKVESDPEKEKEEPKQITIEEKEKEQTTSSVEEIQETQEDEPADEPEETPSSKEDPVEIKETPLTLDEQIQRFMNESQKVHEASELLNFEDREILSVMNETIHQNIVYLKDLSEQLSTVKNKQLITHLIDERNRMSEQIEKLEQELKETRAQVENVTEKYDIKPERVRFMHQMIVATIDDYLNRPNQALALARKDFRNKVSKEVSDLVRYVLRIEE